MRTIVAIGLLALLACGSDWQNLDGAAGPSRSENDAAPFNAGSGSPEVDGGQDADRAGGARDGGIVPDSSAPKDGGSSDAKSPDGSTPAGAAKTILVTVGLQLDIYDLAGNLLQTVPVPAAHHEPGEGLRGVAEDADGNVHIFAGTFQPKLATWNGSTWSSRAIGGTPNVVHYGHVVAVGDTILSTTMNRRVTRYNRKTEAVDYVVGTDLADINKGADGKLYAVDVFDDTVELDPTTLSVVRTLPISPSPDLIATDATGGMHGAWTQSGKLVSFPVGRPATYGPSLGIQDFQDIDIAPDGTFVFCGNGKLVIGQLGAAPTVTKTLPFNRSFCSFGYRAR